VRRKKRKKKREPILHFVIPTPSWIARLPQWIQTKERGKGRKKKANVCPLYPFLTCSIGRNVTGTLMERRKKNPDSSTFFPSFFLPFFAATASRTGKRGEKEKGPL